MPAHLASAARSSPAARGTAGAPEEQQLLRAALANLLTEAFESQASCPGAPRAWVMGARGWWPRVRYRTRGEPILGAQAARQSDRPMRRRLDTQEPGPRGGTH